MQLALQMKIFIIWIEIVSLHYCKMIVDWMISMSNLVTKNSYQGITVRSLLSHQLNHLQARIHLLCQSKWSYVMRVIILKEYLTTLLRVIKFIHVLRYLIISKQQKILFTNLFTDVIADENNELYHYLNDKDNPRGRIILGRFKHHKFLDMHHLIEHSLMMKLRQKPPRSK